MNLPTGHIAPLGTHIPPSFAVLLGTVTGRPLQTLEVDSAGRLWFFSQVEAAGSQVNLSYADPRDEDFASISGTSTAASS